MTEPASFAVLRRLSIRSDGLPTRSVPADVLHRLTRDGLAELDRLHVLITARGLDVVGAFMRDHDPDRFDCDTCGAGVAADEDGCCATCGVDCWVIANGVPVLDPDGDAVEPHYSRWRAEGERDADAEGCQ